MDTIAEFILEHKVVVAAAFYLAEKAVLLSKSRWDDLLLSSIAWLLSKATGLEFNGANGRNASSTP